MKKTVTTILSLALALIMVSSLSSGVILAKGDDDHDKREKNKNKYHTVRDVAILDCFTDDTGIMTVKAFDISEVPDGILVNLDDSCAASLALLLNAGFGKHSNTGIAAGFSPDPRSRHMLVRNRRVRN